MTAWGDHKYNVRYGTREFPRLPVGSHSDSGKRSKRAEIWVGHVRKMCRALGIDIDCMRKHLENV